MTTAASGRQGGMSATPGEGDGSGAAALAAARRAGRGLVCWAALFGTVVNLLALTGPVFMLQVYDRVLVARSEPTLLALFGLVVFLFAVMGVLDHARGRLMARVAARLGTALAEPVLGTLLVRSGAAPAHPDGLRALAAVERLVAAPVLLSLFDLLWTPLFLAGLFLFHPLLGGLAAAGGALLVGLALVNQALGRMPARRCMLATETADRAAAAFRAELETIRGLGMTAAALERWSAPRAEALAAGSAAGDIAGGFTAAIKAVRLLLQSAMLALGSWLVLRGALSAGAMVACSILLGRALAPIEQAVAQWPLVRQGLAGWCALAELLSAAGEAPQRLSLPRPAARLEVEGLTLMPPGRRQAVLRQVSFTLAPGQALGVVGPSGAGKSSLARAVAGLWPPAAGRIRLGGVPLDQYPPDMLGRLIGYLPQRVALFEGTVAENISRLDPRADDDAIVAAARRAGAHDMIVGLPEGYGTRLDPAGGGLSGGQAQRIGLARALFGDPVLLLLDEPGSNLDNDGMLALGAAIRDAKVEGRSVLVLAHRPSAIRECDLLLLLEAGVCRACGPRDRILREAVVAYPDGHRPARGTGG